eukprot:2914287-Rhodomonas_salina.2
MAYWYLSPYASARPCPVLTWRIGGADRQLGRLPVEVPPLSTYARAMRCPVLTEPMAIYACDYLPTRLLCSARTDRAYGATREQRLEESGAGVGLLLREVRNPISLCTCYALSGTEIAYRFLSPYAAATPCPRLTSRMLLHCA